VAVTRRKSGPLTTYSSTSLRWRIRLKASTLAVARARPEREVARQPRVDGQDVGEAMGRRG
jgi:hypothetical protein